jgi:antirestriction protein ArdC
MLLNRLIGQCERHFRHSVTQRGEDLDLEQTEKKTRRRFLLRFYRVFNLEQCDLPQAVTDKLPRIDTHQHDPIEAVEKIFAANARSAGDYTRGLKSVLLATHGSRDASPARAFHQC